MDSKERTERLRRQLEVYYIKGRKDLERQVARMGVRDPGDKEDVIQDAFCSCLSYLHTYDEERGSLKKWVNNILCNAAKAFKSDKRMDGMVACSFDDLSTDDLLHPISVEDEVISQQELELVQEAIALQPPGKQTVLEGFLILGHSVKEVAAYSALSADNVRKIVQRFREELGPRVALGS